MDKIENKIFNILKTRKRANEFLIFSDSIKSSAQYVGDFSMQSVVDKTFGGNVPSWVADVIDILPGLNSGKLKSAI